MTVTLLDKARMVDAVMADRTLSPSAKCAMAVLLLRFHNGKTGRCFPAYDSIADRIGLKRRRAIAVVAELVETGWLQTVKGGGRSNTNAVVFNFERVHDVAPFEGETVHEAAPFSSQTVHEDAPFTDAEPDKGCSFRHERVHDPAPKSSKNIRKDVEGDTRASAPVGAPRFADFMAIYPKKVGEKNARFQWDRIVGSKEATPNDVIAGAVRYAASREGENPQYTKDPANWLRDACWKDEIAPKSEAPPSGRRSGRGERMTAGEAMVDAAFNNIRG